MIKRALVMSSTVMVSAYSPASAQSLGQADMARGLDSVVVTAQKRTQTLRDIPATITVIDRTHIDRAAGNDLANAFLKTAGATFNGLGFLGNNSVSLRGFGGLTTFGPFDSAISFTLDEAVVPLRSFDASLLDIERIEILKGPQGTLYGRSALGGAVNIVTRPLSSRWSMEGSAERGEHGYANIEAAGGGAFSDAVLIRGALRYSYFDGDVVNIHTAQNTNQSKALSGRLTTKFLIDDDTSLTTSFQADREDRIPTGDVLRAAPDFPVSGHDALPSATRDTDAARARLESNFSTMQLVLLASYEKTRVGSRFDLTDSIVAPVAFGIPYAMTIDPATDKSRTHTDEETISVEARLQSRGDNRLTWAAGLSYLDLTFDRNLSRRSVLIGSQNLDEISSSSNKTFGIFGDISHRVTERLEIGAGVRIARDELRYRATTNFTGPISGMPPFSDAAGLEDTYAVGNVRASYDFGSVVAFMRYARGYGSGGYGEFAGNALTGQPIRPFLPSKSDSFEAGMRGGGGAISYGVSAFYNAVDDGQTYAFDFATFATLAENLDYESYGVEAELALPLAEWLKFEANAGFQRAYFTHVPPGALSNARKGNRVPNTPEVTFSAAFSGKFVLGKDTRVQSINYRLSVHHTGDRASDPANSFTLPAFTILEGRVGYDLGPVELFAFGSNLLDETPVLYGQNFGTFASPVPTANVGRGRVLGAGLKAEF